MNKTIKLEDGEGSFVCPCCGGSNSHHRMVEIYNRSEDELHDRISISSCVEIDGNNKYELSIDQSGKNPSPRRGGIRIAIECEECEYISKLIIYQHKGKTFMELE